LKHGEEVRKFRWVPGKKIEDLGNNKSKLKQFKKRDRFREKLPEIKRVKTDVAYKVNRLGN
jgi:pyruvate/oxaloacetate carboxyltransferase